MSQDVPPSPPTPSPAAVPPTDAAEQLPAAPALQRRVLRLVLGVSLATLALGFLVLHRFSYTLPEDGSPLRYGTYGFSLARFPTPEQGKLTVAVLGNSVYQGCGIVERMQRMSDEMDLGMRFLNYSQCGSGISDHVVQAAKLVDADPDLLVVALIPATFEGSLPRFRTDADQMAFDLGPLRVLSTDFYRREFTLQAAADSALSSLLPFRRLDAILRNQSIRQGPVGGLLPDWLLRRLTFPTLNLGEDWLRPRPGGRRAKYTYSGYPDSTEVLDELLRVVRGAGIPLLFIWQENGIVKPDLLPALHARAARDPGVRVADFQDFWNDRDFSDWVHPAGPARDACARRHFTAIAQALLAGK
ncbi:MAG: hypothetical protein HYZ53_08675 [Planctomycetes bacterium]|nr:hypothetical protein [Planctomycetota bacterium]